MTKQLHVAISALLLLPAASAFAQPVTVQPQYPCAGDSLLITYRPDHPQATLSGSVPLYAKISIFTRHGGFQWYTRSLSGDSVLHASLLVPADAASLSIRFYSLNKDDEKAMQQMHVYESDRKTPVAGAFFESFLTGKLSAAFEKEIGYHPDNYLAYGKYFNVLSLKKSPEECQSVIDRLLPRLVAARKRQRLPEAGLLAAICIGYAKTNKLNEARTCLFEMFHRYPAAEETDFAFTIYDYEYYKASGKPIQDTVKRQLAAIYKKWPGSALASDLVVNWYLYDDRTMTVGDFEQTLLPLYRQGKMSYLGLSILPGIYIDRREHLDSAEAMLLRALRQWQDGSINHEYRLSNHNRYMSSLLQMLSQLYLLQQNYQQAIVYASAGLYHIKGTNHEDNFTPELLQVRARAYRAVGNWNCALDDYTALYRSGKAEWLDSMRVIFPYCSTPHKNWDEFTNKVRSRPNPVDQLVAPDLSGSDLAGNKVQLSSLKGKVVVLNFWGTGCGPCIREMPQLNKLVEKFRSNDKVVFLAITSDKTEKLRSFFRNRQFNYTVVNNVAGVIERYNIDALPVHIVIDKNGRIINRSVGASEDIVPYLERQIEIGLQ
ncbi:TlpA family protein disulfide reductase [Longitalea luteola]|uniref:TlpA family protein disulfide reductase n=1 Tax=Longitalea luteola TaxID=2812563 RepID=UPI001A9777D5